MVCTSVERDLPRRSTFTCCCLCGVNDAILGADSGRQNTMKQLIFVVACSLLSVSCAGAFQPKAIQGGQLANCGCGLAAGSRSVVSFFVVLLM